MSENRRACQFGLSKLLLWTAVVGLYLGMLRALDLELILALAVTCWLVAVIGLRATVGRTVAGLLSALAGIILSGWFTYSTSVHPSRSDPVKVLVALTIGGSLGYWVFLFVEAVIYVIDWADRLMGARTGDQPGEKDA